MFRNHLRIFKRTMEFIYGKKIEAGSLFLREKSRSIQRSVLGFKRVCSGVQALIERTIPMAVKQGRISSNHTAAVSLAHGRTFNISFKINKKYDARKSVLSTITCN